jgi:hypothetical protein
MKLYLSFADDQEETGEVSSRNDFVCQMCVHNTMKQP